MHFPLPNVNPFFPIRFYIRHRKDNGICTKNPGLFLFLAGRISGNGLKYILLHQIFSMEYFSILLIALGLSMDSLAVCISGGIFMKKFCIRKSLKMALIMGAFQGGMTLLGWMLSIRFSHFIRDFDHWIAFLLLAYLGGKMIYESLRQEESCLTSLSDRTLLTLGVATSIDALAVGVGLAFLKTNIFIPALIIAITTFLLSLSGVCCGFHFGKIKNLNVEFVGGLILIFIGLKILIEHTLGY